LASHPGGKLDFSGKFWGGVLAGALVYILWHEIWLSPQLE
jgi:hypothetical protein